MTLLQQECSLDDIIRQAAQSRTASSPNTRLRRPPFKSNPPPRYCQKEWVPPLSTNLNPIINFNFFPAGDEDRGMATNLLEQALPHLRLKTHYTKRAKISRNENVSKKKNKTPVRSAPRSSRRPPPIIHGEEIDLISSEDEEVVVM